VAHGIATGPLFAELRDRSGAIDGIALIGLDLPERGHDWLFDRFALVCDLYAVDPFP
jgi:hypothetical protein